MKLRWIVQIAYVEIKYISMGVGIKPPTPPITKKNEHPTPRTEQLKELGNMLFPT